MFRIICEIALIGVTIFSSVGYWRARRPKNRRSWLVDEYDKLTRDRGRLEEKLKGLMKLIEATEKKPTKQPVDYERTG